MPDQSPKPGSATLPSPAVEFRALNRMGFGPRPGSLERVRKMGLQAYIEEQVNAPTHDHFNVNAQADEKIAATWPIYDREVIRKHCFGNFRRFLEDVAMSVAMQFYLNNVTSRASPANENYARELFELHSLGAENYFNHLYNRRRAVPGGLHGKPIGYIDQDVYEAARAFTGWTIADGSDSGRGDGFPNNGKFHYYDGWHDLVQQAVDAWMKRRDQPDQIRHVVRAILLAPEFIATESCKVKRPFELVVSFLRATGADVTPNANLFYQLPPMGQRMFEWPTPTGHPDESRHWLSTQGMLTRWNIIEALTSDWMGAATFALEQETPAALKTYRAVGDFWVERMLGYAERKKVYPLALKMLAGEDDPHHAIRVEGQEWSERLRRCVKTLAMCSEFQLR